jgi:hypothetical protein
MDFSKFKVYDWLIIGGGIGMLIFGTVLDWIKIDAGPFGSASGGNAFDFFFTGTVPWILLVATAVVTFLLVQGTMKSDGLPWPMIIAFVTVLSAFLLLMRFIFNPGIPDGVDRGIGMILSLLAGIVSAVGGVMMFTSSGGQFSDFTDMDKLKASFSGGGDSAAAAAPAAETPTPAAETPAAPPAEPPAAQAPPAAPPAEAPPAAETPAPDDPPPPPPGG